MRFSVINLLWIACSIPFIFVGATLFVASGTVSEEEMLSAVYTSLILMAALAPFTIFPATTAMFAVARKWVTGEVDVPLFKTFFRGYKENYKQSMIGGIIYTILIAVMIVDFIVYREQLNVLSYIFIAFLALLGVSLFNFFSMLVHYHMKTFQLLKNAVLITIGKPFRSLSTAVMCGLVVYISLFHFTFLIPFFMGSIIAFLAYWNFNIIYVKLQEQVERQRQSLEEEAEEAAEMDREDLVKDDFKDSNK